MRYTQSEFFRLMESIEAQGGQHLDDTHDPVFHVNFAGDKIKGQEVVYCGEAALFLVPYVGLDLHGAELPVQPVEVCAVDDMVGRWPRFAEARAQGST